MKKGDRKEYPDFEEFSPEGWEVVEDSKQPDFIKEAKKQAQINISNRGGKRKGAGRPVGSKSVATKQIRLPEDIVNWLQSNKAEKMQKIRDIMVEG